MMHDAARQWIAKALQALTVPDGPVVEIGARNINGTIRDLFTGRPYIGVDAMPGPDVDVVCNGAIYRPEEPAAVVVCMETLEHTDEASAICTNAHRILKPGGVFLVTAAGDGRAPHSAIDGQGIRAFEWYQNVSVTDLESWLADFEHATITRNPAACDVYASAIKGAA